MNLPIFELMINEDINDDAEVNFVALVDRPAIQRNWNAFKEKYKFEISSEDKRIISGALMLADTPIFRSDVTHGDYYVMFSKDTIFKIAQKFFKKGYQANVNLMHDPSQKVDGVVMFESFISDKDRGILPMKGFEDAPDGSWFGSFKVEDDETWAKVKNGDVRGFSVEGIFEYGKAQKKSKEEEMMEMIYRILEQVEMGGEGSGCRGDNCGRPKGSGSSTDGGGRTVQAGDKDLKALMDKAKEAAPELDKIGKALAEKYGAKVTDINLKSEGSILRKVNNEEGGNLENIKDAVRNTIVHDDAESVKKVIEDLKQDGRFLRAKTQSHETDPLGYSGNIVNVKLSNGQIAEIQVNTPKMIFAKEKPEDAIRVIGKEKYDQIARQTGLTGGKGHAIYEEYRELVKRPNSPENVRRLSELETESKNYYKNFLD